MMAFALLQSPLLLGRMLLPKVNESLKVSFSGFSFYLNFILFVVTRVLKLCISNILAK